ncbi:MAG: hypothetical protein IKP73_21740 [Bacteroidales bacterium]|nr:hypothetical protein [Bacteroidales bacterium]
MLLDISRTLSISTAKFRFAVDISPKPADVMPITSPYWLINASPRLSWSMGTLI